jgi:hypothetical protein
LHQRCLAALHLGSRATSKHSIADSHPIPIGFLVPTQVARMSNAASPGSFAALSDATHLTLNVKASRGSHKRPGGPGEDERGHAAAAAIGSSPYKGLGPSWTRHEIEPPAGEVDMGGMFMAVYTEEQQARLGVNELGVALDDDDDDNVQRSYRSVSDGDSQSDSSDEGHDDHDDSFANSGPRDGLHEAGSDSEEWAGNSSDRSSSSSAESDSEEDSRYVAVSPTSKERFEEAQRAAEEQQGGGGAAELSFASSFGEMQSDDSDSESESESDEEASEGQGQGGGDDSDPSCSDASGDSESSPWKPVSPAGSKASARSTPRSAGSGGDGDRVTSDRVTSDRVTSTRVSDSPGRALLRFGGGDESCFAGGAGRCFAGGSESDLSSESESESESESMSDSECESRYVAVSPSKGKGRKGRGGSPGKSSPGGQSPGQKGRGHVTPTKAGLPEADECPKMTPTASYNKTLFGLGEKGRRALQEFWEDNSLHTLHQR